MYQLYYYPQRHTVNQTSVADVVAVCEKESMSLDVFK